MRMALRLWGSHAPGNAQDSRDANLMRNKKKVCHLCRKQVVTDLYFTQFINFFFRL